jgi:methyl-accepting chemotaxis protein
VRTFLTFHTRAMGAAGLAMLLAMLAEDPRWASQPVGTAVALLATVCLRATQIPLTKYSALSLVGTVAVGGSLAIGAPATALGLWLGVFLTDWALRRKTLEYASINAGREVVALAAAYGLFAWTMKATGAPSAGILQPDGLPAAALFVFAHFFISRALLYFSLVARDKLLHEEKSLIIRYEVIGFGAGTTGVSVALLTLANVGPRGWIAVGLLLTFAGLLLRRILQESIAAEELNQVHAMEQVVASDIGLADGLNRIERLAHRLIDWTDFKVYRLADGTPELLYTDGTPLVDAAGAVRRVAGSTEYSAGLRDTALRTAEPVLVLDAENDPRVGAVRPGVRSTLVVPLRFGERNVGLVELAHHRRAAYGPKELQVVQRFANQLATTLHIHDLRQPLLEAVTQVTTQVQTLNESAQTLRTGGEGVARHTADMSRGIGEESEQARRSLEAAQALHEATVGVARDGGEAAAASRRATDIATEHRETISSALDRLVGAKRFVSESADQIDELARATRRVTEFLGVIREIAEQTNLLSFNAAIEAARAGAAGRGFAVVAGEVRKLAEQSARASEEAGELVLGFEDQMRRVGQQMGRGQGLVGDVETLSAAALAALDQIVETTAASLEHAERIAGVSKEQEVEFGRLRERVARIAEISHRNYDGAAHVTDSARQQAAALRELEGATRELHAVAIRLGELAHRITSV